ncbi:MAG: Maf family protein [Candidatus Sedimenticola sp. (ex Thyasira tokunagai)]
MSSPKIYLASLSPRRSELLTQIGVSHEVVRVVVDERLQADEAAAKYVVRLALEKAEAGLAAIGDRPYRPVLGADTAVVVDDRILGKPADRDEALAMMALLSGRSHRVLTGVALAKAAGSESLLSVSSVTFREVSADEALAYWQSGEPTDKAGGYGIQGLGALFISHLEGSFSGVMGLPLYETGELLRGAEIKTPGI